MYSIKHIDDQGRENVVAAVSTSFDPVKNELVGYGSPGSDKDGVVRFDSGRVFVMNEMGKTVALYNLNK